MHLCLVLLKKREGMLGQIYLFYLLEKLFWVCGRQSNHKHYQILLFNASEFNSH